MLWALGWLLLHIWLLQPAVSSWAWALPARLPTGAAARHSRPPSSSSVPAFPTRCHAAHPLADVTRLGLGFAVAGLLLINEKTLQTFPVNFPVMCWILGPCESEAKNPPFLLWLYKHELQRDFWSCSFSLAGVCFLWYNTTAVFSAVCYTWQECK